MKWLILFCIFASAFSQEARVTVEVYYESLCPDSIDWMRTQMYPTWKALGNYLQFYFNPFGHASYEPTSDGGWTFECQHGPEECKGNLYQSCLLDKVTDNDLQVEAVHCIMTSNYPVTATEKCMFDLGIEDPPYAEVDVCHGTIEGENLLHDFGVETHGLEPQVTWVPWVRINGVYIEEDFDATQTDLKNLLCEKYLSDVPECQ